MFDTIQSYIGFKRINKGIYFYYMANPVLNKSMCSDWFFLGQDFAVRTFSMETVQPVHFSLGAKPANSKFPTKLKSAQKKNCEYGETTRKS